MEILFGCVSRLQVNSILRNLEGIKARSKASSKETRRDIDLRKSLDPVDLSQLTRQVTAPSHSGRSLGLLDYEAASDRGTSGLKKARSNYQKYSPNERYNIGKHTPEFGTASILRRFKVDFPQLRESTVRSIRSKNEEELKVAIKQKHETKYT